MHKLIIFVLSLTVSGCVTGPSQEDIANEQGFLDRLRECGEATTISRVALTYDCRFLECRADACAVKLCGADKLAGMIELEKLEIDQGRCTAEFTRRGAQ